MAACEVKCKGETRKLVIILYYSRIRSNAHCGNIVRLQAKFIETGNIVWILFIVSYGPYVRAH